MHFGECGQGKNEIHAADETRIVHGDRIGTIERIEPSLEIVLLEDWSVEVESFEVHVYQMVCDRAILRQPKRFEL
jgi:hypothetical protein